MYSMPLQMLCVKYLTHYRENICIHLEFFKTNLFKQKNITSFRSPQSAAGFLQTRQLMACGSGDCVKELNMVSFMLNQQ